MWNAIGENQVCGIRNDWQKKAKAGKKAIQSQSAAKLSELWQSMIDYIKPRYPELDYPNPSGMAWIRFPMKGTHANVSYSDRKGVLSVYLLPKGDDPLGWFEFVKSNLKIPYEFEWVDRGDDSFGQWTTKFKLDGTMDQDAVFDEVGRLLTSLSKALKEIRTQYENKISSDSRKP